VAENDGVTSLDVRKRPKPLGRLVPLVKRVLKADTTMVVNDVLQYEDEFSSLYWSQKNPRNMLLEPTYNPSLLMQLVTKNNILAQCVQAMEVNIDGTGWSIEPESPEDFEEQGTEDHPDKKFLEAFFNEPFPQMSFITMRRRMRFDLEATGNSYLEVMRNLKDEVVLLRWIDATTMRLVVLDAAVLAEKEIKRGEDTVKAKIWTRERRYAQMVGQDMVFFKEFGASRDLHRLTGDWAEDGGKLKAEDLASEIIHFTLEADAKSPYGIPRWINQLPSVLGSRKAEEFNLEFFDSGGIPPSVVFVEGGAMAADVTEQLRGFMNGDAKTNLRAAIVEVQSTTGTLDKPGSVKVNVERFGDGKNDSMFQSYDKATEEHVRVGFRLPPLFIGRAQDYNFATAQTAYMVTEAQVFQPERLEFDEQINLKIVRTMGIEGWNFRSNPLTMKNVDIQLKAIELVKDKVDPEEMVETINSIASLDLKFDAESAEQAKADAEKSKAKDDELHSMTVQEKQHALEQRTAVAPLDTKEKETAIDAVAATAERQRAQATALLAKSKEPKKKPVKKADLTPAQINLLVDDWVIASDLEKGQMDEIDRHLVQKAVDGLSNDQRKLFNSLVANKTFDTTTKSEGDVAELIACCSED
jgi:PBSX family phage portal protein